MGQKRINRIYCCLLVGMVSAAALCLMGCSKNEDAPKKYSIKHQWQTYYVGEDSTVTWLLNVSNLHKGYIWSGEFTVQDTVRVWKTAYITHTYYEDDYQSGWVRFVMEDHVDTLFFHGLTDGKVTMIDGSGKFTPSGKNATTYYLSNMDYIYVND